jgi:tetratricopeptide (TPR) repeat protein
MGFLNQLGSMFTRAGREEALLDEGMKHAKSKRPEKALEIYESLLKTRSLSSSLRSRVLFNRALVHSALKNDDQALEDLEEVLKLPDVPDNVLTAAKERLVRLHKRGSN